MIILCPMLHLVLFYLMYFMGVHELTHDLTEKTPPQDINPKVQVHSGLTGPFGCPCRDYGVASQGTKPALTSGISDE